MPIGVPGCPEFACCTASIESVRIVLMQSVSSCCALAVVTVAIVPPPKLFAKILKFPKLRLRFPLDADAKRKFFSIKTFRQAFRAPSFAQGWNDGRRSQNEGFMEARTSSSVQAPSLKYPKTHCSPLPPVVT